MHEPMIDELVHCSPNLLPTDLDETLGSNFAQQGKYGHRRTPNRHIKWLLLMVAKKVSARRVIGEG